MNSALSSAVEQQIYITEKSEVTSAGTRANGLVRFPVGCGFSSLCYNQGMRVVCFHLKSQVSLDEYGLGQDCRA